MAKLEIHGWLLETSWGVIPEDRLQDVMDALDNEEFDRDDFDDILDSNNETGINTDLDIEILVDDERKEFDRDQFAEELEEPVLIEDEENEGQFFLIEETASKGIVYSCELTEDFDPEKLSVWYYNYALGDTENTIDVLEIEYDENECLDRNVDVKGYYIKLLRPDGTLYGEDDEEEADEAPEQDQEKFQKTYIFKDISQYKTFRDDYILNEDGLKHLIDIGVCETSISYSGEDAEELWITFEDTESELQLTPDPDTGWVEEDIGEISVRWSPRNPFE